MLQLFRTNQYTAIFFLLIYAFLLRMFVFVYPFDWTPINSNYLSDFVYNSVGTDSIMSAIIALVLVIFQSILLNEIIRDYRIDKEMTYLPAASYILLMSATPQLLYLSPALLANTFAIIAIGQLFKIYKKSEPAGAIFNTGFWTGVASLFYFGSSALLLIGIIGLFRLRSFKITEFLILIIGFCIPFFLSGVYFFWNDGFDTFIQQNILAQYSFFSVDLNAITQQYIIMGIYAFILIWSILNSGVFYQKTVIQTRKSISLFFNTLFVLFIPFIYLANINIEHLAMINIPLAVFLALNYLAVKNKAIPEFIHLVLFALVLVIQYREFLVNMILE